MYILFLKNVAATLRRAGAGLPPSSGLESN